MRQGATRVQTADLGNSKAPDRRGCEPTEAARRVIQARLINALRLRCSRFSEFPRSAFGTSITLFGACFVPTLPQVPAGSNARVERPAVAPRGARTAQTGWRAGRAPKWSVSRAARTRS